MRTESEVFSALESITAEKGFLEVLAFLAFKDNYIMINGENLDADTFIQSYDRTRLMCAEKTGGFNLVNYRHSSGVYHEQETEDLHRRI